MDNNVMENEKITVKPKKKKTKTILIIVVLLVVLGMATAALLRYVVLPKKAYEKGLEFWNSGNKIAACHYFEKSRGYEDANKYIAEYSSELKEQIVDTMWHTGSVYISYLNDYFYPVLVFSDGENMQFHMTEKTYGREDDPVDFKYEFTFPDETMIEIVLRYPWKMGEVANGIRLTLDENGRIWEMTMTSEFYGGAQTKTYVKY